MRNTHSAVKLLAALCLCPALFGIDQLAYGQCPQNCDLGYPYNTAVGAAALYNTTGSANTAVGWEALQYNESGSGNTALGFVALIGNMTGSNNTAIGRGALAFNGGSSNTAVGDGAMNSNASGSYNVALGNSAGVNLTTGDFNIDIGNAGVAAEANTIRIGTEGTQTRAFIAGILGAAVNGRPVMINANGRLGTAPSSARFKDETKPMDKASEAILALKPVTFRYKEEVDPEGVPQFGLVAEEVEKINRDLVVRDDKGKPYTVRYEAVNAMLLNEFLKEHRKNEEQEATIAQLKQDFAEQQKQIELLTAGLQKVTAQMELSEPAPRTVVSNY